MPTVLPHEFTRDTKILLSFGSREGGFGFAVDLRQGLMSRRGWKEPCAVYLDAVSAADHPMSTTETIHVEGRTVQAYRNPQWRELYQAAMQHAKAMVFIATPAWARSNFCADEYQWFDKIRGGRHDQQVLVPQRLPIVVVAHEQALSMLGKSDRMIAQGAARVSSYLASLPASQRAVRKDLRHADGALIILKQGLSAASVLEEVDAALRKVGV